jgi:hypothetical protein
MFSRQAHEVAFSVETASGVEPVDSSPYLAHSRGDIEIERYLPPHLCRVLPDVTKVLWDEGEYDC